MKAYRGFLLTLIGILMSPILVILVIVAATTYYIQTMKQFYGID
jgi:hypothetical protein